MPPADRLHRPVTDADLLDIHRELLTRLTRRQRDQHPVVNSVNDLIFDALLQWAEAYRVYAANYPIAKWRIDRERRTNKAFQEFFDVSAQFLLDLELTADEKACLDSAARGCRRPTVATSTTSSTGRSLVCSATISCSRRSTR